MNDFNKTGFDRRAVVKGAAWSVPVVAAAAATPLAAATVDRWDAGVSAACTSGAHLALGLPGNIVNAVLSFLGVPRAVRTFTITAVEGDIPLGTQFDIASDALLDVSLLSWSGFLGINVIALGGTGARITFTQPLPQGQSVVFDLLPALLDVTAISTQSISLVGADNPSTLPGASNSASVSVLAGSNASVPPLVPIIGGIGYALQVCS